MGKKKYPEWKIRAWRAGRAFMGGFLGSAGTLLVFTDTETLLSKENIVNWIVPLLAGALAGGLVALGKYLRDLFPDDTVLKKLPI